MKQVKYIQENLLTIAFVEALNIQGSLRKKKSLSAAVSTFGVSEFYENTFKYVLFTAKKLVAPTLDDGY